MSKQQVRGAARDSMVAAIHKRAVADGVVALSMPDSYITNAVRALHILEVAEFKIEQLQDEAATEEEGGNES